MVERKSLADAMALSTEKLAFIKQGATAKPPPEPQSQPEPSQKTIELQTPSSEDNLPKQAKPKAPKSKGAERTSRAEQPNANDILDQVLVPVTIRLQHRTSQALRRAYLEQRLNHAKPDTQQEIVEIALVEWLSARGFLDTV